MDELLELKRQVDQQAIQIMGLQVQIRCLAERIDNLADYVGLKVVSEEVLDTDENPYLTSQLRRMVSSTDQG